MKRRIHSFVWGGLSAVLFIVLAIALSAPFFFGVAVAAYTLVSCLILHNNFLEDMMSDIFEWSFVTFPGLIFTFDLDGIIWLLTVKLLFKLISWGLALLFGTLAVVLGLVVSVFVYPFALAKNIKHPTEIND